MEKQHQQNHWRQHYIVKFSLALVVVGVSSLLRRNKHENKSNLILHVRFDMKIKEIFYLYKKKPFHRFHVEMEELDWMFLIEKWNK